ncbi:arylsulfatase [Acinetobacter pittii]|uniref:arylsulfatase n=1 Tax=Acinetobacter pittii TaxID=48296 RepID=UPI0032EB45AB
MLKKIMLLSASLTITFSTYAKQPNIVLIVADDLGYSDIGAFGSEISTPNLDMLAKNGTKFTNYHTPGTCSPTRAELLSGTDHHLAGIGAMVETMQADAAKFDLIPKPQFLGKPGYEGYLNDRSLTISQILKNNGYETIMVGKWHLGFENKTNPINKGFSQSYALLNGVDSHFKELPQGMKRKTIYTENGKKVEIPDDFFSTDFYTKKLIEYLNNTKADKPFFAYVAYTAPHWPLQAPEEYLNKYKGKYDKGYDYIRFNRLKKMRALNLLQNENTARLVPTEQAPNKLDHWNKLTTQEKMIEARKMELYAAMIDNMDDNIGKIIQHLKEKNEYDNTLFIFVSDNGSEGFYRTAPGYDNSYANLGKPTSYETIGPRWAEVSSTPLYLWKGTAAEGGVSAPAIIKLPHSNQNSTSNEFVSVRDILPTILDITKSSISKPFTDSQKYNQVTGKSWFKYLKGKDNSVYGNNFYYADELHGDAYIRNKDWKLTRTITKNLDGPEWRLYNMSYDRSETQNLIERYPNIAKDLESKYIEYTKKYGVQDFLAD